MKQEIAIVAYKCKKCGKLHYPFHDRCLACKSREFEPVKPEGKARLLTFTRIYNLPWGFDVRYLVIGVVEFENKVRAMGQIHVDDAYPLKNGMLLNPSWGPVRTQYGEHVYGLVLEP
ncbi:MAG TPA: hypothetical protein PKM21_11060 [Anaerolineales bacterium]|nr:hypothetical protein [Anaerolineales bacterium]